MECEGRINLVLDLDQKGFRSDFRSMSLDFVTIIAGPSDAAILADHRVVSVSMVVARLLDIRWPGRLQLWPRLR